MKSARSQSWALIIILVVMLGAVSIANAAIVTLNIDKGPDGISDPVPVNYGVLGTVIYSSPGTNHTKHVVDGAGVWDPYSNPPGSVPEMVGYAHDMGISNCRFPGGGDDNYDWKHSVGPMSLRPKLYGNNSDEPIGFGLPEFMEFKEEAGCEPIIVVSDYTGTPQDASDMVDYLNTSCSSPACTTDIHAGNYDAICKSPVIYNVTFIDDNYIVSSNNWPQVRICDKYANGRTDLEVPWNIEWFEYGNESWNNNTSIEFSAGAYAGKYHQYQSAMKLRDPNINLGAQLDFIMLPMNSTGWDDEIISLVGESADFFITHNYVIHYMPEDQYPPGTSATTPSLDEVTLFETAFAGSADQLADYYRRLNKMVLNITGRGDVPIAVTEFNGHFIQDSPVPYRHSLGNALLNADHIRQLMRADNIAIANNHVFSNAWWGAVKGYDGLYTLRPNYYTFQFYNNLFGEYLIEDVVSSETYESTRFIDVMDTHGESSVEELGGIVWNSDDEIVLDTSGSVTPIANVSVDTSKQYRLSARIRSENVGPDEGAYLYVHSGQDELINRGFENGCGDYFKYNIPNCGWLQRGGIVGQLDGINKYEGNFSVLADFDGTDNVAMVVCQDQKVQVKPHMDYVLSGYIKTNITGPAGYRGVQITVNQLDSNGESIQNQTAQTPEVRGETDWMYVSKSFKTHRDAVSLDICLRKYFANEDIEGQAWFDAIALTSETDQVSGTTTEEAIDGFRYVDVDFRPLTSNIDILASGITSGSASVKNMELQEINSFTNYGAVPYLSVNASKGNGNIYLMVINKHVTDETGGVSNDITANINFGTGSFSPSSVRSWTLTGPSVGATNEEYVNVSADYDSNLCSLTGGLTCTFPPHSLTAVAIYTDADGDGYTTETDCDDGDNSTFPGAAEVCNGKDNDCNGQVDDVHYYRDSDEDEYGDPNDSVIQCTLPEGYAENSLDCDDGSSLVNPGAMEICDDSIDNNCDGTVALCSPADWYNDGLGGSWSHRQALTVAPGMTALPLNNYPLLVTISDSNNPIFTYAQEDGDDILFTDSSGNRIEHEIEKYDAQSGTLVAWVRLPVLNAEGNLIEMYYGNASTSAQQNREAVWDSDFVMVQHLSETSGQHYDSTTYDNDSTEVSVSEQGSSFGLIGGADNFGEDTYVLIPDKGIDSPLDLTMIDSTANGSMTLSAWIYARRSNTSGILSKVDADYGYTLRVDGNNCVGYQELITMGSRCQNWCGVCSEQSLNTGTWNHVAYVYDEGNKNHYIYINGVLSNEKNRPSTYYGDTAADLLLGAWGASSFDGLIDEVRISRTARSSDWIAADYNGQYYPDNYLSYGIQNIYCPDGDGDGYSSDGGACGDIDCNDNDPDVNPGHTEICDGKDNNCDGATDEGFDDTDSDGIKDCVDPDDDNDGLTDSDEINIYNTAPLNPDSDSDQLDDGEEIQAGTLPLNPDTDHDRILDGQDGEPLNIFFPYAEGWKLSKNSDFSTSDAAFSTTDTFYIIVWSNIANAQPMKKARYRIRNNSNFDHTENLDDPGTSIYMQNEDFAGFSPGPYTVEFLLRDNSNAEYEKKDIVINVQ